MPGRFPLRSMGGHEYMLLMFAEDPNFIHVEPMISRHASHHTDAYARGTDYFKSAKGGNFHPEYERLDNETSAELESFCNEQEISIQYVAPHQHRANKAERAIRTFKNHWIACHSTAHSSFPLSAWDKTLPQVELTLNLLRASHINPSISAWQQVHGRAYDFRAHPIAPIGTKVLIHEKPNQCKAWELRDTI